MVYEIERCASGMSKTIGKKEKGYIRKRRQHSHHYEHYGFKKKKQHMPTFQLIKLNFPTCPVKAVHKLIPSTPTVLGAR